MNVLPSPRPRGRAPLRWLLLPVFAFGLQAVAASAAIAAAPAATSPVAAGHWDLGVDLVFSTIEAARGADGFSLDQTARGLGLRAGRRLGPGWRLQANVSVAEHHTITPPATLRLTRATFEAVRLFRPGHQLRPWLLAGAGVYHVGTHRGDLPCDADGPGLTLAGGWELRLSRHVAIHGAARAEAVRWRGGPALPAPLFDRWQASSQVDAGLTISL